MMNMSTLAYSRNFSQLLINCKGKSIGKLLAGLYLEMGNYST